MIIQRWQAPQSPTTEQALLILENEGLDAFEESCPPQTKINDHRHAFCEVRIVVKGELLFNLSGNQFLLRAGDRLEIPANTKHAHANQTSADCVCVCAHKAI